MPSLAQLLIFLPTALFFAGQDLHAQVNPPTPILVSPIELVYDLAPATTMRPKYVYDASFGATTSNAVTADHLISSRPIVVPTTANDSTHNGESLAQQFTGKERDAETWLDYFGARYMSAGQGRL